MYSCHRLQTWAAPVVERRQKVIDTGYHGDARDQAQLDAVRKQGLPREHHTGGGETNTTPEGQFANKKYKTATFQKTTADTIAEVACTHCGGDGVATHLDCPT
ncbi:hypothetical protein [Xylella fastidiosa]|uniref:hypothetical protein n=1 Tax=Xylella fastidiosa TaxID=2371 RepID=UPI003984EC2D